MSAAQRIPAPVVKLAKLPPLEQGDHLNQKTFHERYEAMPSHVRAELIGGVVFMPSPLKRPHGRMHPDVATFECSTKDAGGSRTHIDRVAAGCLAIWLQRHEEFRLQS